MKNVAIIVWSFASALAFSLLIFMVFNVFKDLLDPHEYILMPLTSITLLLGGITLYAIVNHDTNDKMAVFILWAFILCFASLFFIIGLVDGFNHFFTASKELIMQISFITIILSLMSIASLKNE